MFEWVHNQMLLMCKYKYQFLSNMVDIAWET